jgi:hypothetical protein
MPCCVTKEPGGPWTSVPPQLCVTNLLGHEGAKEDHSHTHVHIYKDTRTHTDTHADGLNRADPKLRITRGGERSWMHLAENS